ncbi:hypothetical protein SELMODRAFT_135279, partial [Selaginella moellendorffii]
SGIEHDYFLSLVKPLFEDMPLVAPPEPAKSEYVGGEWPLQGKSDVRVKIPLLSQVCWKNMFMQTLCFFYFFSVLVGSFSTRGPGKGIHSRLCMYESWFGFCVLV